MTVLEKIKRCVSLVWDFQEFYGEEDIEDFCRNELHTYPQHNEIMEYFKHLADLEKENAELRKIAEFQQSSNMSRHFENKKLKEGLAVGPILNKGLNSLNKTLEEERDKYRNMVFDKDEHLTKAKEILRSLYFIVQSRIDYKNNIGIADEMWRAEQFLNSEVEK